MRFYSALIAVLVAIVAVAAGAQAATGDEDGIPSSIPDGNVIRVKAKDLPSPKDANRIQAPTTRAHNGNDDFANALNLTASVNGSVCRAPSFCFLTDDNVGATTETGENVNCPPEFDSTVWYVFQVTRAGLLDVVINNTQPDSAPAFQAVFGIYNGSTGDGFCGAASTTTTNFSDTFVAGPGTTLGTTVFMQVGSALTGQVGTTFDLNLSWDPDSDGDGVVDSSDRCDTQRGPSSLRGCPDSDGDRIPNIDDRCDTLRGPSSLGGCPDSDGDGLIDPSDRCPRESSRGRTDRNANGCPDWRSIPDLRAAIEGIVRGNRVVGVRFRILRFRNRAPRGTRISIKCRPRRNCRLRRRGSLRRRLRSVRFRTKRTRIRITAKKSGYVGKVFTMTATYKTVRGGGRNVILRGPKKRCIPVGARRSRRCTSSLLLR